MPSKNQHLKIITQNYGALSKLSTSKPSDHTDWCVTIIFYMTLHYIHAYLGEKYDKHPTSHAATEPVISEHAELKMLYAKYRSLQDDSRKARYDGEKLSIYEMRNQTLSWFKDIQNKICELLGLASESKYDLYPLFPLNSE